MSLDYLSIIASEMTRSKNVTAEVMVRIRLRLFHLLSITDLSDLASSREITSRLVPSNRVLSGMFPKNVTPKAPAQ